MATNTIRPYLKHTVSVVTVTLFEGSRSTVTTANVPAFITEKLENIQSVDGDQEVNRTVVYLLPTQVITEQDELIVDGNTRPILRIKKGRNLQGVHHLRVMLN